MLSYNNAIAQLYRYSATWPGSSEMEIQRRLQMMRITPSNSQNNTVTP